MIAVDTNLLVYAHRREMPSHERSREALEQVVSSGVSWAIPWPCVHEFLATVTRVSLWEAPTGVADAVDAVGELVAASGARLLAEAPDHWSLLSTLLAPDHVRGARIHDARIAAICLSHGVSELLTADRDFAAFPELRVRNPLANP